MEGKFSDETLGLTRRGETAEGLFKIWQSRKLSMDEEIKVKMNIDYPKSESENIEVNMSVDLVNCTFQTIRELEE